MTGEKLGIGAITFRILWFVIAGCWVLATALLPRTWLWLVAPTSTVLTPPMIPLGTAQWSWFSWQTSARSLIHLGWCRENPCRSTSGIGFDRGTWPPVWRAPFCPRLCRIGATRLKV